MLQTARSKQANSSSCKTKTTRNKQKKNTTFFPATRVGENVAPSHPQSGGGATVTATCAAQHNSPRTFSLSQFFTTAKNPHETTAKPGKDQWEWKFSKQTKKKPNTKAEEKSRTSLSEVFFEFELIEQQSKFRRKKTEKTHETNCAGHWEAVWSEES